MIFKSVARVSDDNPETQRLRLADDEPDFDVDDDVELLAAFDDSGTQPQRYGIQK